MKHTLDIIYEDKHFVIINKPPNYLAIPDRFRQDIPNVKGLLQQRYDDVFVVHRIDKETSGVMVFALTSEAHKSLSQQFEARGVDKFYWALVLGKPQPNEGEINTPLIPHPGKPGKMTTARKGKASLTLYKTLETFRDHSLVEANIKTGRMHQIRVHLESIGFPLAVDAMYGGKEGFYLSEIKGKKYRRGKQEEEERPLMSRVSLHARRLAFNHPQTNERINFEVDLPKDFRAVLKQLRKVGS